MAKDFSEAINEIMPLVESGDKSTPFIITKDSAYGDWQVCYPSPAENAERFFVSQREHDPYAVMFTGADFSKGSFPYVYDKVLSARLREEFDNSRISGDYYDSAGIKEANAMLNFFEDRISEFSHKLTDYLTTVDKPLAKLAEMCPYNMAADNDDWYFNEDFAFDAVHYIENELNAILQGCPAAEVKPKPLIISGNEFTETQSVQIGSVSIVLAECIAAPSPFLVCNRESDEEYNHSAFPGYLSAIREFTMRQTALVSTLEAERETRRRHGVDSNILTAEYCLPESNNADFTGKTLIVKASELSPEFRYSDSQLIVCSHGSGAHPGKNGRTVFGAELYSGEIVCYGRYQIEGIADEALLPQWAKTKLEIIRDKEVFEYDGYHFSEPPQKELSAERRDKQSKPAKPLSLLGELNDAKAEAAARNAVSKDKPQNQKRGEPDI